MTLERRADIQGLRALAVAAVILFHAGVPGFSGGFVGVDVFFVISGFLITGNLLREVGSTGRIDLLQFWGNRAKRLLPNALATLAFILLLSAIALPTYRWESISRDVFWAAAFASNYHFAAEALDYFRANDPPSLVQHFWSLSVEEQFYFVLPILIFGLAVVARKRQILAIRVALIIMAGISLWLGAHTISENQPAAFFHAQNRAWQFCVGGLLVAYWPLICRIAPRWRNLASLAGIAIIAFSITWYGDDVIYPGAWALLPTAGAAMALMAMPTGSVARMLSVRPAVWLGDRSYSFYLWHWPLIALAAERMPGNAGATAAATIVSALLAALAYERIERPLHRDWRIAPKKALVAAAAPLSAILATAFMMPYWPTPPVAAERAESIARASTDFGRNYRDGCHLSLVDVEHPPCVYGDPGASRTIVLFGDSHAAQWFEPLRLAAEHERWRLLARTKTSCPSVVIPIWYPAGKTNYRACDEWRSVVMTEIEQTDPDVVVLANYSGYYGWLQDEQRGGLLSPSQAERAWQASMNSTYAKILATGAQVVAIRDNPKMFANYRDCLSTTNACSRPRHEALAGMASVPDLSDVVVLDFSDIVCDADDCPAMIGQEIIYQDRHHFTASFASTLWPAFSDLIGKKIQHP